LSEGFYFCYKDFSYKLLVKNLLACFRCSALQFGANNEWRVSSSKAMRKVLVNFLEKSWNFLVRTACVSGRLGFAKVKFEKESSLLLFAFYLLLFSRPLTQAVLT
jgi:hypothetical protein